MPLIYGSFNVVEAAGPRFVASRTYLDNTCYLLLNNGNQTEKFTMKLTPAADQIVVGEATINEGNILLAPGEFVLLKM